MQLFILLSSVLFASVVEPAPQRDFIVPSACSGSETASTLYPNTTSAAATSSTSVDECASGGLCDCRRVADTNSDEYFQCVTNPNCEHCWISRPSTSTKTPLSNVTQPVPPDFLTMSPGTYTITTNSTVLNIVVTQKVATPTSSTQAFVTMTQTVVVTVPPGAQTAKVSASSTESSAEARSTADSNDDDCKTECDCSRIADKDGKDYLECLTNPDCEKCHSRAATVAAGTSAPPNSTKTASLTSNNASSSTSSSDEPKETCAQFCNCSTISDKESEGYFQCVTNPVCERCIIG